MLLIIVFALIPPIKLFALKLPASPEAETRYLLFQVFTAAGNPDKAVGGTMTLKDIPNRASLESFARGIKDHVGSTGNRHRKLGFGPARPIFV